jgi:Mycobacterium membrane protein
MIPTKQVVKSVWLPVVVAIVVAVAGFCICRLRSVLGVHDYASTTSTIADDIRPFNPKHVTYEVFGPVGTLANINYLDINAQPKRVDDAILPWSLSLTTTLPSVSVNIVAQGNTTEIGCRILVNGDVKDQKRENEASAQTYCLVKSA